MRDQHLWKQVKESNTGQRKKSNYPAELQKDIANSWSKLWSKGWSSRANSGGTLEHGTLEQKWPINLFKKLKKELL